MNWFQKYAQQTPRLYHGTDREFQNFHFRRHRSGGKAIFLTSSLANAQAYGSIVYEVKPISSRMFNPDQNMNELEEMVDRILERESQKPYGQGKSFYPATRSKTMQGVKNKSWIRTEHPIIIEALIRLKFDGFIAQEGADLNYAFLNPNNLEIIRKINTEQLQNSLLNDPELNVQNSATTPDMPQVTPHP